MLKKITVNSKKELAEILLSGRVLYLDRNKDLSIKLYFDENGLPPFRVDGTAMEAVWDVQEFYEEVPWQEELKKRSILCWVSDTDPEVRTIAVLIEKHDGKFYHSFTNSRWKYATPVERDAKELL